MSPSSPPQSPPSRALQFLSAHHPSGWLLLAQLIMLILYAYFPGEYGHRALFNSFGTVLVLLVIWVVDRSPAHNGIAWLLAIPAVAFTITSIFITFPVITILSAIFEASLYFYAVYSLIAYMMADTKVTVDELFAIGATFTLLAWGFAYLYLMLQTLIPGSFVIGADDRPNLVFIEFLFLSFTNLSATGFGDITPLNTWARLILMLEQVSGVGYIAIVVSRLIGLTLLSAQDKTS